MSQVVYNLSVLYIKMSFDIISTVCELNLTLVAEPAHVKYYMVAVMLLINDHWDCWSSTPLLWNAQVLPIHCGTAKLYPTTAGHGNSPFLLRDDEAPPLHCKTPKFYHTFQSLQDGETLSDHCETAQLPEKQATSTTLNIYQCINWELAKGSKPSSDNTWPVSIQQTWIMDQMDTEIWEILYGFKLNEEGDETKLNMLMYYMGDRADHILHSFKYTERETETYDTIKRKLGENFVPQRNSIFECASTPGNKNPESW